jgi:hypothetical protein
MMRSSLIRINNLAPLVATFVWLAFLGAVPVALSLLERIPMPRFSNSTRTFREGRMIVRKFLGFQNRWRLFAAQLIVTIPIAIATIAFTHVNNTFRTDNSALFQTIAQVQATVLVAFALAQFGDEDAARAVRPPVILAVLLGAVALCAGVAGTAASLPMSLERWAFGLSIAGGAGSLVTLAYVSWRLLR